VCPDLDLAQSPGSVAMSFGNEKLARLLSQHDIAYDDRLSVCKALADVSSNAQNASRIVASQELIQSMANILNSTSNVDIDNRHQVQVCLAITRCLTAGGDKASMAFTNVPGLIEGLCKLKRDPEPFVRVAAETSLRLLVRCDEACGVNRRLLRLKWQNVLDVDPKNTTSHDLSASPQTAQQKRYGEPPLMLPPRLPTLLPVHAFGLVVYPSLPSTRLHALRLEALHFLRKYINLQRRSAGISGWSSQQHQHSIVLQKFSLALKLSTRNIPSMPQLCRGTTITRHLRAPRRSTTISLCTAAPFPRAHHFQTGPGSPNCGACQVRPGAGAHTVGSIPNRNMG
jgi:hypothetical protein